MRPTPSVHFAALYLAALMIATATRNAHAQAAIPTPSVIASPPSDEATLVLPDSPGSMIVAESAASSSSSPSLNSVDTAAFGQASARASHAASRYDKYIAPGEIAPSITTSDKYLLGAKQIVTPLAVAGWLSAAGYSQLIDNAPNYGTDRGAFGQRLGASAIRGITEGYLSDAVMASIFRQDPRYYILGRGHGFFNRAVYAASRTLITRTDSGRSAPNYSLITGNIEGSILTNAYYPERNRDVKTTAYTFAGSIGGSAVGFVVSEFLSDTLEILHLKKSD